MPSPIETLKGAEGTIFKDRDGSQQPLLLLPHLTDEEFRRLEASVPCPIPDEARELFRYARGFRVPNLIGGPHKLLTEIDLSGLEAEFGLEQVFPHARSIAGDGCGNFWVIDLTSDSQSWGPVFYACHDAPVIVYQTDSLAHFIEEALRGGNSPWESEIADVNAALTSRIWRENPGVLSFEQCADSSDADLKEFAGSLDLTYEFVDLRAPKLGDGFSWGRYGSRSVVKRFGEKRIFANQRKSRWQRFKDAWK
jgi:hypothetical protein